MGRCQAFLLLVSLPSGAGKVGTQTQGCAEQVQQGPGWCGEGLYGFFLADAGWELGLAGWIGVNVDSGWSPVVSHGQSTCLAILAVRERGRAGCLGNWVTWGKSLSPIWALFCKG